MKQVLSTFVLLVFVGLGAGACTSTDVRPETPRQRLVVAEATYQSVVRSAISLVQSGSVSKSTQEDILSAVFLARAALDSWQLTPDNTDSRVQALQALTALQALLAAHGAQPTVPG